MATGGNGMHIGDKVIIAGSALICQFNESIFRLKKGTISIYIVPTHLVNYNPNHQFWFSVIGLIGLSSSKVYEHCKQ
jgi:hypothetical protein